MRALEPASVALMSESERIDLVIVERLDASLAQAVLRPSRPLASGETYWLVIDSTRIHKRGSTFSLTNRWLVEGVEDHEPPVFETVPTLEHKPPHALRPWPSYRLMLDLRPSEPTLLRVSLGPPGDIPLGRSQVLLRSTPQRPYSLYDGPCGRNARLMGRPQALLALLSLVDIGGNRSPGLPLRFEFSTLPPVGRE